MAEDFVREAPEHHGDVDGADEGADERQAESDGSSSHVYFDAPTASTPPHVRFRSVSMTNFGLM